jgi:hypothetical protein
MAADGRNLVLSLFVGIYLWRSRVSAPLLETAYLRTGNPRGGFSPADKIGAHKEGIYLQVFN